MNFDPRPLLESSYWLTVQPPVDVLSGVGQLVFGGFLMLFILGITVRVVRTRREYDKYISEVFGRVGTMFIVMGLLGVLLYFFSFEQISFLGARFWYPIWFLTLLAWAAWILKYVKVVIPKERETSKEQHKKDKYLPNKK